MNRVLAAARLHLIHPAMSLSIPWLVVGLSFAINMVVWHVTPAGSDDGGFTGGVMALYVTVLILYVQAVTQLLPFAMGVSISRRTFYLGTALFAAVQSLVYGIAISALAAIEDATGGWGADMSYWAPAPFEADNPVLQVFVSGAPLLAFAFVGIGMGVVHKRWGQLGTWGLILGSMVVLGGLAILITWLEAWSSIGSWFTDQSVLTLTVALPLILAAVVAALSWGGIRRVVP
jgi:hypothetical protein